MCTNYCAILHLPLVFIDMPVDICTYTRDIIRAIARYDVADLKCSIIEHLRSGDLIQINVCPHTYVIRKWHTNYRIYSTTLHHYDLHKFCISILTDNSPETIKITPILYFAYIYLIKDFIKDNPAQIMNILYNYDMTIIDFIAECIDYECDYDVVINALIDGDYKVELRALSEHTNIVDIFETYLCRFDIFLEESLYTAKYPLLDQHFNMIIGDPMPLVESLKILVQNML